MIAYNNVKINSILKKFSFTDVLPLTESNLTMLDTSNNPLGIIRKTATTIERSVI